MPCSLVPAKLDTPSNNYVGITPDVIKRHLGSDHLIYMPDTLNRQCLAYRCMACTVD